MIETIELFAGVGGFRVGLERANTKKNDPFKVIWSNQWEPSTRIQHASEVYKAEFGIKNHSSEDIAKVIEQDFNSIPIHFCSSDNSSYSSYSNRVCEFVLRALT